MFNIRSNVGQKRALLIGINKYYLDDAIGNLNFCVNDVAELNEILADELRGNFATNTLHSGNSDTKLLPSRSNILAMIKLLANNSDENDTIFVYFAGHGFEQGGVNYLLPADARINVLSETAITIRWIKDTLSGSLAKKKILVIDACHAGSKLGRSSSTPMSRSFQEELFQQSEGFAILSSCKINQLSYDISEKNHGSFSYFLLEGLRGSADEDKDNIITVPDANKYVSAKLREWCLKTGLQQNPTFSYNVAGDFIFVKVPSAKRSSITFGAILKGKSEAEEAKICEIIEDIAFSSFDEITSDNLPIEQLIALVLQEENRERKIEKAKLFLKEVASRRFSTKYATESLMFIINKCLDLKEIKKWIKQEAEIKIFLILEFVSSYNFNIAGTMAQIIEKLLPVLSDNEILEMVKNIEDNGQITNSFKARSSLISIVDSCRNLMPYKQYMALRSSILGK